MTADIISFVGQVFASGLYRVIENLVHTADICPAGNDGGQILECAFQRRVKTGYYKQKHKKQRNIDLPADQKHGSGQSGGGDSKFQNQGGRYDKKGGAKLRYNMAFFRLVDFPVQTGKIAVLCVICFQILHTFDTFLDALLQCNVGSHRFPVEIFLNPGRKESNGKGNRKDPDRGKGHFYIEKQQADRNEGG